jgi:hypothetical protein
VKLGSNNDLSLQQIFGNWNFIIALFYKTDYKHLPVRVFTGETGLQDERYKRKN